MAQSGDGNYTIARQISLDAGHRVPFHDSKCKSIHGHRYLIEAVCSGPLQTQGTQQDMVIDFGFLKEEMVSVIETDCDHTLILWIEDPLLTSIADSLSAPLADLKAEVSREGFARARWLGGDLYLVDAIPTAETLARHWFQRLRERVCLRSQELAKLLRVVVWETPNCRAEYPCGPV